MENIIKKVLYTGVGFVAATTEKLQKAVDDLVERGKISEEEGKKVVDDVVKTSEYKKDEYEGRFRKLVDSTFSKLNLPKNDGQEKLEKRIKSLEIKVGLLAKEIEAQKKERKAAAKKKAADKDSK
ncbi:MAG: hypothetical protein GY810_08015 [Aureispira sp.]|nr:hypothetical protein [Aureispira sp.]